MFCELAAVATEVMYEGIFHRRLLIGEHQLGCWLARDVGVKDTFQDASPFFTPVFCSKHMGVFFQGPPKK